MQRWQLAVIVVNLLLLSTNDVALASIVSCGACVCDRLTLTCDFDSAKDRLPISDGGQVQLRRLIPSPAEMDSAGVLPSSIEELYVNCKKTPHMRQQRLTRDVLAHFSSLKKLLIVRCDLEAIDADSLQTMTRLEEFDVSDNNLKQLPARMFGRLVMQKVTLSENRQLQLNNSKAFADLTLQQLLLTSCGLTEFPTEALTQIRDLKMLILSNNEISVVPQTAQFLLRELTVFYLDSNPLHCGCANRWLREFVNWNTVSPEASRKSKLPTCKSPFNLMDIELTKIDPIRFQCPPLRISNVDLQLGPDSASLTCQTDQSSDDSNPLDWFIGSGALTNALPVERGNRLQRLVRRSVGLDRQRLAVRVTDTAGQSAELNLTIEWPPELPPPQRPTQPPLPTLPIPAETSIGAESGAAIPEKPTGQRGTGSAVVDSSKQFTLLEMIIAVIGTFMSTSLIFLLACQFVRWYKRRDKKLWATYVSHHQHPLPHPQQQLPQHPQYSATYNYSSHQPSSHEYDVPRIDQPCLPKPPPPSQTLPAGIGAGGVVGGGSGCGGSSMSSSDREFLDFNNPRLMYNV